MVTKQWVFRDIHTWLSRLRPRSLSLGGGLGGSGFWPFFPAPSLGLLVPLFILACVPYPSSTCRIDFSKTDTCPISPYPKWLGVVVKAEKYCSVRCRVFNCSNGSLSFVLCRQIVQGSFLHQRGCVWFFPKLFIYRSCPFF